MASIRKDKLAARNTEMASFFSGLASQAQSMVGDKIPGMGGGAAEPPADGEAPAEGGENGEAPPEQGGFMGGIMGKANALKAKAAETAAAAGAGNLQGMTESMAGGVMGQVSGLIPGMKKEEEVPDPAAPAKGEYAEYTEEQQYAEQGYEEQ